MAVAPVGDCERREATRWCVVTGGRGFMARHLVSALLRSGEWRVRITDLAPTVGLEPAEEDLAQPRRILGASLRDGLAVYASADVCDLAQLTKAFEGVDTVFHTAAPDALNNNFQLHYKVNVEGTKKVINACTACNVEKLIYTSSSGVVFDGVHGLFDVDESTPYPDKFIVGDGKNCDDFVYVENVVHGHICAGKTLSTKVGAKMSGGKVYFITNMDPMNMWDFLYMLLEELGYKRRFRMRIPGYLVMPIACVMDWSYNKFFSPYKMRQPRMVVTPTTIKYMTLNRTFSCNKAVVQLGYKPIISLKEGVKITKQSFIQCRA